MALRGLTVSGSGTLMRDGVRFRNIGLNYSGGIVRTYSQASATACAYASSAEQDAMLDVAQAMKVKIIRVFALPYYPAQWRYGVNGGVAGVAATAGDREAHYLKIDAFIGKCRARGIGVILSLFVRYATIPDLAGQTCRAGWLSAGATRTYAQAVMQEIVTRYINEEAVYGYSIFGELNHYNDATDATKGLWPIVNTGYGTAASYAASDTCLNNTELRGLMEWAYAVIRAVDSNRVVLTGNGPNSYTQPGGVAGIAVPIRRWFEEQVRDNPTNCGCIHFYGNIGYSSHNFRGLSSVLTGSKHWQKIAGRAFLLEEFGNQPWIVTDIIGTGSLLTITTAISCPIRLGDEFKLNVGSVFDGLYTAISVSIDRSTITASSTQVGSWSGSVKGLQHMSRERLERMLSDIIHADIDVALFWAIDSDPSTPVFESVTQTENVWQQAVILGANASLGW